MDGGENNKEDKVRCPGCDKLLSKRYLKTHLENQHSKNLVWENSSNQKVEQRNSRSSIITPPTVSKEKINNQKQQNPKSSERKSTTKGKSADELFKCSDSDSEEKPIMYPVPNDYTNLKYTMDYGDYIDDDREMADICKLLAQSNFNQVDHTPPTKKKTINSTRQKEKQEKTTKTVKIEVPTQKSKISKSKKNPTPDEEIAIKVRDQKERRVQLKLEERTGYRHQKCRNGIIDLFSEKDKIIIEIKTWKEYKHAYGQLAGYQMSYPDCQLQVHLFGPIPDEEERMKVMAYFGKYKVQVTWEPDEAE